jgi:hypothetical protein
VLPFLLSHTAAHHTLTHIKAAPGVHAFIKQHDLRRYQVDLVSCSKLNIQMPTNSKSPQQDVYKQGWDFSAFAAYVLKVFAVLQDRREAAAEAKRTPPPK